MTSITDIFKTDGDWDWGKIAGAVVPAVGAYAASQSDSDFFRGPDPATGYQGGIPDYTGIRQVVPGTYDPDRRSGSGGQRYFSDMHYVPSGDQAAKDQAYAATDAQKWDLAVKNDWNPAQEEAYNPDWYLDPSVSEAVNTIWDNPDWTEEEKIQQILTGMQHHNVSPYMLSESLGIPVSRIYDVMNEYGAGSYSPYADEALPSNEDRAGSNYLPDTPGEGATNEDWQTFINWLESEGYIDGTGSGGSGTGSGDDNGDVGDIGGAGGTGGDDPDLVGDGTDPADSLGGTDVPGYNPYDEGELSDLANYIDGLTPGDNGYSNDDVFGVVQYATDNGYTWDDIAAATNMTVADVKSEYNSRKNQVNTDYFTKLMASDNLSQDSVNKAITYINDNSITAEQIAAWTGYSTEDIATLLSAYGVQGYAGGGYVGGGGDGMADSVDALIEGGPQAALSHGEFVVPADVVSHLGNGNSDAGAEMLYSMMGNVRTARTGNPEQGRQIDASRFVPGAR